jgi:hypothetical protein
MEAQEKIDNRVEIGDCLKDYIDALTVLYEADSSKDFIITHELKKNFLL